MPITSQQYYALIEAAPCGFLQIEPDGTITLVNAAALKMFGYDQSELVGRHVEILVPRSHREVHVDFRNAYFANPVPRQMGRDRNVVGVRRDGTEFPADVGLTSIRTPSGECALAWIVDITERKRLEDQKDRMLDVAFAASARQIFPEGGTGSPAIVRGSSALADRAESKTAFEDAMRSFVRQARVAIGAHLAIISYVPGGDFSTAFQIQSVSAKNGDCDPIGVSRVDHIAWKKINDTRQSIRVTDEELNGKEQIDSSGQHDLRQRGWIAVPIVSHESNDLMGMMRFSDKCEGTFTDEDSVVAARLAQLISPVFSLQYNNSRIHALVEQRTSELADANDALAQSNAELEQFAYIASHDLQEPLRKIISYCQLLIDEKADRLDEEGIDYLNVASDGAKRLKILIHDLLAFSRVTTRGRPLAITDTNASLRDALANLEITIEESRADIQHEVLPNVMADQGQLTLLFQNLIGNAIKYCGESTPKVCISVRDAEGMYEFAVRDNGIGIDLKYRERIFQIFQRLHSRRKYSGTGIGLALCKRIVERFGGEIWVDSKLGEGSTFYFTLRKANDKGERS